MPEVTIDDILREVTAPSGDERGEGQDGFGSFKARYGAIASSPPIATALTTGASPLDVPWESGAYFEVTTGGTGGVEVLNLLPPATPIDGYVNGQFVGARRTIVVVAQTDNADVVKVTVDGDDTVSVFNPVISLSSLRTTSDGVVLDFVGANTSIVWAADSMYLEYGLNDGNDDTDYEGFFGIEPPRGVGLGISIQQVDAGAGNDITIVAGSTTDTPTRGGNLQISGGFNSIGNGGAGLNLLGGATTASGGGDASLFGGIGAAFDGSGPGGATGLVGGITQSPETDVDGGAVTVTGGERTGGGTGNGGTVTITGGNETSGNGGDGGDVVLSGGTGSGDPGNVKLPTLPTTDPGVIGAIYMNAITGALFVSLGP